jgi:hypothetical protein
VRSAAMPTKPVMRLHPALLLALVAALVLGV